MIISELNKIQKLKFVLFLLLSAFFSYSTYGQVDVELVEGTVSYLSSQNVYIKFTSTDRLQTSDTLYLNQSGQLVPALQIDHISSVSVVGHLLDDIHVSIGDLFVAKLKKPVEKKEKDTPSKEKKPATVQTEPVGPDESRFLFEERIKGRFSVSSYTGFTKAFEDVSQRMRYRFSLNAEHIGQSRFSTEAYISFSHKKDEWEVVKENIYDALKIYSLAVSYEASHTTRFYIGRKTSRKISNVGPIDGFQFEKDIRNFTVGSFAGLRPDYQDFSFNTNLFQFGAYLGHKSTIGKGHIQNSFAIVEQKNHAKTDRRFAYIQHTNSIVKGVNFFWSAELDLYEMINGTKDQSIRLSSMYLSLRYRVNRKLSFSTSYDARKNIIYYESYKNFIDRLLEEETRQGFRLRINFRPVKYVSLGASGGYRFQKNNISPSKNAHIFITHSRVPFIQSSASLSVNILQTPYLQGNIFGLRLTKELVKGKLSGGLNVRVVDYQFNYSETSLLQKIVSTNLSWRLSRRMSISLYHEGTFSDQKKYHRINTRLIKRF